MKRRLFGGGFSVLMMSLFILDTQTAVSGAANGIETCINTVIPSLFPFFIASKYFLSQVDQRSLFFLRPILRICGVPKGAESIFLLGILGGYPVGASVISNAYENGYINKTTANRLLGFCNNAGPAFIFGMTSFLFDSVVIGWYIWFVQILSTIIVGIVLTNKTDSECHLDVLSKGTFVDCVEDSIRNMGKICGWIIFFRVLIAYFDKFIGYYLNDTWKIMMIGLLEMSNGCILMCGIKSESIRFIFMSAFLSLGGICVLLQTKSVAKKLDMHHYLSGKILQCELSVIMSTLIQPLIFRNQNVRHLLTFTGISILLFLIQILLMHSKKIVASRKKLLYNHNKANRKGA